MWTAEDRERYKDDGRRYPSNLTDVEWDLVRPLFERHRQLVGRRSRKVGRCRPYAAAATPVISAQSSNALVRMARYSVAVT